MSETRTEDHHDLRHLLKVIPHKPGWFERHAVQFLKRRAREEEEAASLARAEALHAHPPYVLSDDERTAVQAIVRRTVVESFVTGAASAAISVATSFALRKLGVESAVVRWSALGGASLVATLFEVSRIYFLHLTAVSLILRVTGARIAATREDDFEEEVAHALARAALDLPDPTRVFEEIDPERESNRIALLLALLLYKGKRSISNFLAKEILLDVCPTSLMLTLAPLVSLPITGAWNALVSWRVLREARLRAVGPSAVQEICDALLPGSGDPALSDACRLSLLRAVGVAMVREHAAHPNVYALLWNLTPHLGEIRAVALDDTKRFLDAFAALAQDERTLVLQILQVAAAIDGSVGRKLRVLIADTREVHGLTRETAAVDEIARRLNTGERIDPGHVAALAS